MAATTLPALLLGGEVGADQDAAFASWRKALQLPDGARAGRRPLAALPAGRRRRRRRSTPRWACCDGEPRLDDQLVPAAGNRPATAPSRSSMTPERAGWALQRPAGRSSWPPGGTHTFDTGETRSLVLPLSGSVHGRRATARRFELAGRRERLRRVTDFAYVPRDATVDGHQPATAARFALPRRPRHAAGCRPATVPPRTCRSSCAAPARPAARSTTSARPEAFERRRADRRRGAHAGRQLVVLPAAQARRGRARRETELEEIYYFEVADGPAGPGVGYQRVYGTPGRPIDVLRRGAHRRRRPDPARLARPVDGRARLRPVLPQRDGRARRRAGLADLRRPGARLDPRHLGGPGRSTRGCRSTSATERRRDDRAAHRRPGAGPLPGRPVHRARRRASSG